MPTSHTWPTNRIHDEGVWYAWFFLANREIRAAKAAGGWYEGLHQGIAVDTG
ncbi:hypothetical protein [Arthrobacter sp. NicSoilC12]|uniref:hypothetical protein n=1 Tax=Arthrobacter sp. NicSoilC12 TaxID=2831001 RepID=UPI001CC68A2C|nr:hypothetical protein [Arthrobacter sp. NicSoilC12]GIU56978.1 hypothetical protein NicSoilC12_27270 [Arthrobacter sp. NicSoilC12]